MVMTARWTAGARRLAGPIVAASGYRRRFRLDGRFVLRADIAAIDDQLAVGVERDEDAGDGDFGRVVADGTIVEFLQRRLDLAEPLIDLVRQFVGVSHIPRSRRSYSACKASRVACSASVMSSGVPAISRRPWVTP